MRTIIATITTEVPISLLKDLKDLSGAIHRHPIAIRRLSEAAAEAVEAVAVEVVAAAQAAGQVVVNP